MHVPLSYQIDNNEKLIVLDEIAIFAAGIKTPIFKALP